VISISKYHFPYSTNCKVVTVPAGLAQEAGRVLMVSEELFAEYFFCTRSFLVSVDQFILFHSGKGVPARLLSLAIQRKIRRLLSFTYPFNLFLKAFMKVIMVYS
jgi:hypothetical protein